MNVRSQLLCARSGYVFLGLFVVGWVALARFVPSPDPAGSAEEIAAMFRGNILGIRLGMCLCIFASALLLSWGGAIVVQMWRIEGRFAPLSVAWIIAQACLTIEFIYPCMFWAVAAFRPEESAERIRQFNDLAWLPFLGITSTALFQAVALGVVVLTDRSADPILPRWFGYFQLYDGLLFAPAGLIMFFKDGPLAWNGLIAFWVAILAAAAWFLVTTPVIVGAIRRQGDQPRDTDLDLAERVARLEGELAAGRASEDLLPGHPTATPSAS
jgi:hypothetical protein